MKNKEKEWRQKVNEDRARTEAEAQQKDAFESAEKVATFRLTSFIRDFSLLTSRDNVNAGRVTWCPEVTRSEAAWSGALKVAARS